MDIDELLHNDRLAQGFFHIKETALQETGEFDMAKHITYYARLLQLDPENREAKAILDTTVHLKGSILNPDMANFACPPCCISFSG